MSHPPHPDQEYKEAKANAEYYEAIEDSIKDHRRAELHTMKDHDASFSEKLRAAGEVVKDTAKEMVEGEKGEYEAKKALYAKKERATHPNGV